MQRINISFSDDLARDFRRYVPARKRSKFIAELVSDKLHKKKSRKKTWLKNLKANRAFYEKIGREIDEDFKYAAFL